MVLFCRCALSFCQIDSDIVTEVINRMGNKSNTNGSMKQTLTLENVLETNVILISFNFKDIYRSRS